MREGGYWGSERGLGLVGRLGHGAAEEIVLKCPWAVVGNGYIID